VSNAVKSLPQLFAKNRAWSDGIRQRDPEFFAKLSRQQSPEYLWIGCSDSRVPANQIIGLLPGEVFVHRNIANVVVHTDLNCLSVIQFAVDVLKIRHVIVCGHYGCAGVRAALRGERQGLVDNWLRHVQDVREKHAPLLAGLDSDVERTDRLCELNVLEQALNVCQTSIVRDAWQRGQELAVHGWIYALHDGLLRDLGMAVSDPKQAVPAHRRAVAALGTPAPAKRRQSGSRLSINSQLPTLN
jgi:carbonic anhydrase